MRPNFMLDGLDIGREAAGRHYAGVEVAVSALRLAEGHLDVNA